MYPLKITLKKKSEKEFRPWIWVVLFAIAFAWVESSVVVYLRQIYFDGSFAFPIKTVWIDGKRVIDELGRIEIGREIATIVMLLAVSFASGRNKVQKICFFIITFGIWDIFYYFWLRVLIGWPESLMTWDLLFFIPLPWVGPVITPLLISLAMVIVGSVVAAYDRKGYVIRWRWYDWLVEFSCAILIIAAFCWDWKNIIRFPDGVSRDGIPRQFAWWLYLPAYLFSISYFVFRFRQIISGGRPKPDP